MPAMASEPLSTLRPLIELYGVSGHEGPVREHLSSTCPRGRSRWWMISATSRSSFGKGGKPLVFVAHMDEVGFEISEHPDRMARPPRERVEACTCRCTRRIP